MFEPRYVPHNLSVKNTLLPIKLKNIREGDTESFKIKNSICSELFVTRLAKMAPTGFHGEREYVVFTAKLTSKFSSFLKELRLGFDFNLFSLDEFVATFAHAKRIQENSARLESSATMYTTFDDITDFDLDDHPCYRPFVSWDNGSYYISRIKQVYVDRYLTIYP